MNAIVAVPANPTVTAGPCVNGVYTAPSMPLADDGNGISYTGGLGEDGNYSVTATLGSAYIFGTTAWTVAEDGRTAIFSGTVTANECAKDVISVTGLYQPVDIGGKLNAAKGSSTVPVKFDVTMNGDEVTTLDKVNIEVQIWKVSCASPSAAATVALETTATSGSSGLRYDATSGQWVYTWKTPKVTTDVCYAVSVNVSLKADSANSVSTPSAYIQLKK